MREKNPTKARNILIFSVLFQFYWFSPMTWKKSYAKRKSNLSFFFSTVKGEEKKRLLSDNSTIIVIAIPMALTWAILQ